MRDFSCVSFPCGAYTTHDRYDVRLLLDHLLDHASETMQLPPLSPSGWSDLPSDSEDTFFFSPDELEDYRREKRRRLIDRGREERLKALAAIDSAGEDLDPWGGSDEEVTYPVSITRLSFDLFLQVRYSLTKLTKSSCTGQPSISLHPPILANWK